MHRADTLELLKSALIKAMGERAQRPDFTESGGIGWMLFERQVMIDETGARLLELGLEVDQEALIHAVSMAESSACGHIDYAVKWALGCTDFVQSIASSETREGSHA